MTATGGWLRRWLAGFGRGGARRAASLGGGYFAWRLTRDSAESFADPVAQFKYGSTGGDRNFGLPYVMWEAMPSLFRDLLPEGREDEGWAAFGFIYEDAADLPPELGRRRPVGTSLRNHMGIDRIFLNCGGCHVGSVRTGDGRRGGGGRRDAVEHRRPLGVPGLPRRRGASTSGSAPTASSPRSTHLGLELDPVNRLALRFVGVGMVRERLLAIVDRFDDFVGHEPTFGPGRFDTFNPAKALLDWDIAKLAGAERDRRRRLPGDLLQGAKEGHAAALGRQQHQGQRAQPLGRLRHRRDAADPRPRVARAD